MCCVRDPQDSFKLGRTFSFLQERVFLSHWKSGPKLGTEVIPISFFHLPPTSNHLHPLQESNLWLVVVEDVSSGLKRFNVFLLNVGQVSQHWFNIKQIQAFILSQMSVRNYGIIINLSVEQNHKSKDYSILMTTDIDFALEEKLF